MNRFYTFLALIVGLIAHNGHCMVVPKHNKPQMVKNMLKSSEPRFSEAFCAHQKMKQENPTPTFVRIDPARQFISTLAKPRIGKQKPSLLTLEDEAQALHSLTDNQRFLLELHTHDDVRFAVIRVLFNDNQKAALFCSDLPIDKVLELYNKASQTKIYYPVVIDGKQCSEEHYVAMTAQQAYILFSSIKNGTIDASYIKGATAALNNLKYIDPQLMKNADIMTDAIRLYPSWSDRVSIFCSANSHGAFYFSVHHTYNYVKTRTMFTIIDWVFDYFPSTNSEYSFVDRVAKYTRLTALGLHSVGAVIGVVGGLLLKYGNYRQTMVQTISNQPSLTDLIKNKES